MINYVFKKRNGAVERRKAIGFVATSTLAFACMAACVKSVKRLPFMEIVFLRGVIGLALMFIFLPYAKTSLWGKRKKSLIVRGFVGVCALCLHFFAITRLPLATAMFLTQLSPMLVVIMAALFLKEKITPKLIATVALGLLGTMLLLRPNISVEPLACFASILSGFFAAVTMITIRHIGKAESVFTSVFYYVLITTVVTAPFALPVSSLPTPTEWLALIGVGFFSFYGQIWLTSAFRIGPASTISAFIYLTPVFSYALGFIFWKETLSFTANIGAAIIILSGIGLSYFSRGIKGEFI